MTTITALPTPPTRQDPINFADRADTFLAALPTFATETNTVASEINDKYLAVINADIIAENLRGQWTTATAYALKDVYTDNGIAYIVVVSHTSTTIANDAANGKVKVYQGVLFSDLSSNQGSSLVGYTAGGAGAADRILQFRLRDSVSILDYKGSDGLQPVGDYGHDDTEAIQAALNTGKSVWFPKPLVDYKVTASLVVKPGQILHGPGKTNSDTGWSGLRANMAAPLFLLGDGVLTNLRHMSFQNITAKNDAGSVIRSRYSTNWNAFNCSFASTGTSINTIDCEQTYRVGFYNCDITKSGTGWVASLLDNSNVIKFDNCTMSGGSAGGVADVGRSYNVTFDTCVFEISKYGMQFGTNPSATKGGECNGINIHGCSWEQYTIALQIGNYYACRGVDIRGNFFSDTGTSGGLTKDTMMILGRISGLTIESNVLTPAATEYIFDFWHVLDLVSVLPCVMSSRIQNNEFTTSGLGYKLSGHFVTFPSLGNQIAKGLMMEFGINDKDTHSSYIGSRVDFSTGAVLPTIFTNASYITKTGATGGYIEKIEIISVDPSLNLSGTLSLGYSGAFNNLSIPLATRAITGAANNGSGLVRITSTAHGYINGQQITVASVTGTTEANGVWVISNAAANTYDLVGSAFVNAYVSGGNSKAGTATVLIGAGNSYYSDLTANLLTKFMTVSDFLQMRLVTAAGTGTLQVNITYRK